MKLSASIMAHPSRKEMVDDLLNRLDREVTVVWDRYNSEWDTAKRAWQIGFNQDSTHHMVIQDDVLPCRDFLSGIEKALEYVPDGQLLGTFYGSALLVKESELGGDSDVLVETQRHRQTGRAVDLAQASGASWITMCGPIWGPAFAVPTDEILNMLNWCTGRSEVYDQRITLWCIEKKKLCYQTYPCLAEHKDQESLVLPGRTHARVARKFIGADESALSFDPTGGIVNCR